jgi:hypothetical protein
MTATVDALTRKRTIRYASPIAASPNATVCGHGFTGNFWPGWRPIIGRSQPVAPAPAAKAETTHVVGNSTRVRRLTQTVPVKAPSSFALAFMSTYFLERRPQTSGAELALRFPLPKLFVDGLTIEKRVVVQLRSTGGGSGKDSLAFGWEPQGAGTSLPSFEGTLLAVPEAEATCRLTILGAYTPPGGIAGLFFDRLIGYRIANATVAALLAEFKESIETDYAIRLAP